MLKNVKISHSSKILFLICLIKVLQFDAGGIGSVKLFQSLGASFLKEFNP